MGGGGGGGGQTLGMSTVSSPRQRNFNLSFSLLLSAIMHLRGTRSFHSHSQDHSIALACVEAKVH